MFLNKRAAKPVFLYGALETIEVTYLKIITGFLAIRTEDIIHSCKVVSEQPGVVVDLRPMLYQDDTCVRINGVEFSFDSWLELPTKKIDIPNSVDLTKINVISAYTKEDYKIQHPKEKGTVECRMYNYRPGKYYCLEIDQKDLNDLVVHVIYADGVVKYKINKLI